MLKIFLESWCVFCFFFFHFQPARSSSGERSSIYLWLYRKRASLKALFLTSNKLRCGYSAPLLGVDVFPWTWKIHSTSFPIFRVGRAFERGNLELHQFFRVFSLHLPRRFSLARASYWRHGYRPEISRLLHLYLSHVGALTRIHVNCVLYHCEDAQHTNDTAGIIYSYNWLFVCIICCKLIAHTFNKL